MEETEDLDEMQRFKNVLGILFLVGALILIIYVWIGRYRDAKEVSRSFDKTQGWIVKYWDRHYSDAGNGRTITYRYYVNEQIFSRDLYTMAKFDECDDSISAECSRKRFWVIFSRGKPEKSLINFNIQIQDIENPEFPGSIEDFE